MIKILVTGVAGFIGWNFKSCVNYKEMHAKKCLMWKSPPRNIWMNIINYLMH